MLYLVECSLWSPSNRTREGKKKRGNKQNGERMPPSLSLHFVCTARSCFVNCTPPVLARGVGMARYFPIVVVFFLLSCAKETPEAVEVTPVITEEDLKEVEAINEPKDIVSPVDPLDGEEDIAYPTIPNDLAADPYWMVSDVLPDLGTTKTGCTDPLSSNYDASISPQGEDGSCQYDDYVPPGLASTKKTYRNVFLEVFISTRCAPCIIPVHAMRYAKTILGGRNASDGTDHRIIDIYSHVSDALRDPLSNEDTERRQGTFSVEGSALPMVFFDQIKQPHYLLNSRHVSRSMHHDIVARVSSSSGNPHLIDIALTSTFRGRSLEGFFSLKIRTGDEIPTKRRMNYTLFLVENRVISSQRNIAAENAAFTPQYEDLVEMAEDIAYYAHPYVLRRRVVSGNLQSIKVLRGEAVFTRKFVYDDSSAFLIDASQTERFHLVLICFDNDNLWVWNSAKVTVNGTLTW